MNELNLSESPAQTASIRSTHLYPGVWFQSATSKNWYQADPDVEGGIAAVRIGDQVFVSLGSP